MSQSFPRLAQSVGSTYPKCIECPYFSMPFVHHKMLLTSNLEEANLPTKTNYNFIHFVKTFCD